MSEEKRRERERCILAVRRREEARFNVAIHDSPPSFPREARLNVLIVDGIFPGRRIPNVSISRLDLSSPPLLSSRCRRQAENRGLADFISVPLTSRHHFSTHGRFPRETLETLPPPPLPEAQGENIREAISYLEATRGEESKRGS